MREITSTSELREIQLNILQQIHDFCVSHNINYSLGFGTLIGAIRHKGYIPWDDDIDLAVMREDYDRLMSSFPSVFNNISIISLERDSRWNRAYAKAYDTRTIEIENCHGNIEGVGIGIDIFPMDNVPEDDKKWTKFRDRCIFLQNVQSLKTLKVNKERRFYKNFIVFTSHILLCFIPIKTLAKMSDKLIQSYKSEETQYVFNSSLILSKNRKRIPKSDFDNYVNVEFEYLLFKAMVGFDDFLKRTYGDYMKLPPLEEQVSHHSFRVYWK